MPESETRPPIADAPLSVILPAGDRTDCVERVVDRWLTYLDSLGRDYELIVVIGPIADALFDNLSNRSPRVRAVRETEEKGIGAVLRSGLAAAQKPLVCYADCDDAYEPSDLRAMLELIDQVELVSGSRIWPQRRAWGMERFLLWVVLRFVFGVRLLDTHCPFKFFRRVIFDRIPIQSDGPFVHAEIIAKANFLGHLMTEVPISYRPTPITKTDALDTRQMYREAWRVFRHPDFGPPTPAEPLATEQASAPPE